MPDAYPLTTQLPAAARVWLDHQSQVFSAPETRTEQRRRIPALWRAVFEYENLEQDDALEVLAFLDSLNGPQSVFTIYDPTRVDPRGSATSLGLVRTAGQTGKTLLTDGWPLNTLIFKRGDVFTVQSSGEHFQVDANVTSSDGTEVGGDGTGRASILISPPIRDSPTDNTPILIGAQATIKVRLDRAVVPPVSVPLLYTFSVEMSEDLLA